jgi:hypothetical protein
MLKKGNIMISSALKRTDQVPLEGGTTQKEISNLINMTTSFELSLEECQSTIQEVEEISARTLKPIQIPLHLRRRQSWSSPRSPRAKRIQYHQSSYHDGHLVHDFRFSLQIRAKLFNSPHILAQIQTKNIHPQC